MKRRTPQFMHASSGESYVQHQVISSAGLQFVPYDRPYNGLPVRGGDFVVVVDGAGRTKFTMGALTKPLGSLSTTAKISQAQGRAVAEKQLVKVTSVEGTSLVVLATGAKPALAWESTVCGTSAHG